MRIERNGNPDEAMHCPNCMNDTAVIDSQRNVDYIRRRRTCLSCKHRFNTYERPEGHEDERRMRDQQDSRRKNRKAVQHLLDAIDTLKDNDPPMNPEPR